MNSPKQLIIDFIHEYLHDDITELAHFHLRELQEDEKFGCPGRKFDADDTNLMRAVYCVLFSDVWEGLNMESLDKYVYRGDTMNTYNTMFGRPNQESLHPGLDKYNPSKELIDKVDDFQKNICGTIGNMTVLPNIGHDYNGQYETINTYRGCHYIWHDFFDQFLGSLNDVLDGKGETDFPLKKLVELNKKPFLPYMNSKGILCLSQGLLWEDYIDQEGKPVLTSKGFFYWRNFGMTREEYLQEAERYVNFARTVIENRSIKMVIILRKRLGMSYGSIEPVSIRDIIHRKFHIPSYQRGYRWSIQQVKELLEDIEDFILKKTDGGIYCIQPLVVKENGGLWDVIDGQQRLTTINIILSCLGQVNYPLQYQTRSKSQEFLGNILCKTKEDAKDNIDFYHMLEARDFVIKWLNTKSSSFINVFTETLLSRVKFIWYDTDTQDPIEVFTRLNIDKIPLTSAELIKAILLNRSNFDLECNYERVRLFQQELASEWDQMESMLQNDEFWLFFHDDDNDSYETRIDYIFDLMCNQKILGDASEDIGTDTSRVFRYFYDYFHRNRYNQETLRYVWGEVKRIFNTIYEWYTNLELFHYVGYLMARPKESTRQKGNQQQQQNLLFSLLQKWSEPNMTIGKFKNHLIICINDTLNGCRDLSKEYETTGNPKTQCRPILLLHNVETVIQQGKVLQVKYKQDTFNKFPFNLYKKEKWDVEHIDSNTTNELLDFNSQKEWLLTSYVIATVEQKKAIEEFCLTMQDVDDNDRKPIFDQLSESIQPPISNDERLEEEEKNMIWNFTLLDEGTNRFYRNAIFPAKRRILIGKEQGVYYPAPLFNKEKGFVQPQESKYKSSFIPPCTKQAFMKYYSPTSGSMVAWTKPDAEAYRHNIYRVLSEKFNVKE